MGCSSCGGASSMAAPSLLASATPAGSGGKWKLTYPAGNSREFTTEWQAQASQAVGGGVIEYIPPSEPVAKSTSTATTSATATATPTSSTTPAPKKTAAKTTATRKTTAKAAPRNTTTS